MKAWMEIDLLSSLHPNCLVRASRRINCPSSECHHRNAGCLVNLTMMWDFLYSAKSCLHFFLKLRTDDGVYNTSITWEQCLNLHRQCPSSTKSLPQPLPKQISVCSWWYSIDILLRSIFKSARVPAMSTERTKPIESSQNFPRDGSVLI